jgi:hypothetical protein
LCSRPGKDHPARKRALAVRLTEPPKPKRLPDPPLPIDDSDGGCDDGPTPFRKAWTRQHAAIRIDPERDYVTDTGKEVYSILADRGVFGRQGIVKSADLLPSIRSPVPSLPFLTVM